MSLPVPPPLELPDSQYPLALYISFYCVYLCGAVSFLLVISVVAEADGRFQGTDAGEMLSVCSLGNKKTAPS